ncbi:enoyl-CoA hydratase-related protein [Nocardioides sp. TF02-7]|uniref:enoyl-CoA hydratase/isomerase family protein n=1 Tax=Nocardioides sp. TF02-7 TaxID=2917724 RepID=UPI001F057F73|nr:enoyl-CoA hydratase-related protein [Nocardioides sp. TF02-7]UMG92731.1 enoyl-CoA hydratase-related protein [Nocardioides sp. TF02-7]
MWIALNRPHRLNAIDRQLGEDLYQALDRLTGDPATRVVVITGEGRAFCAGDDLGAVEEHINGDYRQSPVIGNTLDPMYLRILELIVTSRVPVITAVNGFAAGAGAELACAGDLRIASTEARIGSALIKVAQAGGLVMLSRLVGAARATQIYLSGELLDAHEAGRLGIFTEVVPHDELTNAVLAQARRLADGPTAAIGLFKELREQCAGQPVQLALRFQNVVHIRNNVEVADAIEGANAFVQKRTPRFTGK